MNEKIRFSFVYADAWGRPIGLFEFRLDKKFEFYYQLNKQNFNEEKAIELNTIEIADWIERFENLQIEKWKRYCMNAYVAADGDILSTDYESYQFNEFKSAKYINAYPIEVKELLSLVNEIAPNFKIDEYLQEENFITKENMYKFKMFD